MKINFDKLYKISKDFTQNEIDESMIRSYTHKNPLVKWISFRRIKLAMNLCKNIEKKKILDFGCGTGILFPELKNAKKIYACDLKDKMAKQTARDLNLKVKFIKEMNELKDNSIDIFIGLDVLEHLKNHKEFFNLVKKKVVSNGRLIVSLPTETKMYKLCRKLAGFKGEYHRTNPAEIEKKLKKGFKLSKERTTPIFFSLFKVMELVND